MTDVDIIKNTIRLLEETKPDYEFAYEHVLLSYSNIRHLPVLTYDVPPNTNIFRARTQSENELFTNKSDIAITPRRFISEFARCNRPHQSKFYCAENRPTSYMELVNSWGNNYKNGDKIHVTIGRWTLKKKAACIIITSPDKAKRVSEYDKIHGEALDKELSQFTEEQREAAQIFYEYLFEKFRMPAKNDTKTYLITTGYCNLALVRLRGRAQGIHYPSVPFDSQGVNFAFNESFCTQENIELTHSMMDKLELHDGKFLQIGNQEAVVAGDVITWAV